MNDPTKHLAVAILLTGSACFAEPQMAVSVDDDADDVPGYASSSGADDELFDGSEDESTSTSGDAAHTGDGVEPGSDSTTGSPDAACAPGAAQCEAGQYCVRSSCVDLPRGMVPIPGGTYVIGCAADDVACEDDEHPRHEVMLSDFALDDREVTAGAYADCVGQRGCTEPLSDDEICTWEQPGRQDHPINCVSWDQARDFCEWAGKTLPTETQWEVAARGQDERRFPWGEANVSCDLAVIVTDGWGCGTGETWPVGSKPDGVSPFGAHDLTGNVAEWTADWYSATAYADGLPEDPSGPEDGVSRAHRGGSLLNGLNKSLRAGNRNASEPDASASWLGFRCAVSR